MTLLAARGVVRTPKKVCKNVRKVRHGVVIMGGPDDEVIAGCSVVTMPSTMI